tara:strand:+ start:942 stop:1505 length:564 start_codon:yes stop_codon:yes gene_type:complete
MHKLNYEKYYFISDYDTNLIKYQSKKTNIIFRNYNNNLNIGKIKILRDFCKKKGCHFFLSNNVKLAIKLELDGVYLPSFNKSFSHLSYRFKKKFIILGSVHSLKELNIKKFQAVKFFFLSSLFKKNKNYLGIYKFKLFENFAKQKLVALGGINEKNIKRLRLLNIYGYAGITHFKKKGPLKKGPFNS